MIRPTLFDDGDLAMLEIGTLSSLEVELLEQVRWYRHVLKKAEWLLANSETIEEAFSEFEDLEASVL